jgi:hypothetical protein
LAAERWLKGTDTLPSRSDIATARIQWMSRLAENLDVREIELRALTTKIPLKSPELPHQSQDIRAAVDQRMLQYQGVKLGHAAHALNMVRKKGSDDILQSVLQEHPTPERRDTFEARLQHEIHVAHAISQITKSTDP